MKQEKINQVIKKYNQIQYCEQIKETMIRTGVSAASQDYDIEKEINNLTMVFLNAKIKILELELEAL